METLLLASLCTKRFAVALGYPESAEGWHPVPAIQGTPLWRSVTLQQWRTGTAAASDRVATCVSSSDVVSRLCSGKGTGLNVSGKRFWREVNAAIALPVIAIGLLAGTSSANASTPHLSITVSLLEFDTTTLGDYAGPTPLSLTNDGATTDTIDLTKDATFTGSAPDDYVVSPGPGCPGNGTSTIVLAAGDSCPVDIYFYPSGLGERDANLSIQGSADSSSGGVSLSLQGAGDVGYYQVDAHGNVVASGDANPYGGAGSTTLNAPVVGIASTGNDQGYWLVGSDGGIFSYGDAQFYGSTGTIHLNEPIVGMAATPDGRGYWFVASDGGIFSYGDAQFYGSRGGQPLNSPIVGMAPTPDGGGYWLVASDGGIFSYGDAQFYGSTGNIHLNEPIVGMAATADGRGYWFVASDGGVFSYGDAQFYGSRGGQDGAAPIVGIVGMPDSGGYWVSASNGVAGIYGDAPGLRSNVIGIGIGSVVGMALDGGPTLQASIGIAAIRSDYAAGIHPGQLSPVH